jgi:hypothetical protein
MMLHNGEAQKSGRAHRKELVSCSMLPLFFLRLCGKK